jgi:hypothetical protein
VLPELELPVLDPLSVAPPLLPPVVVDVVVPPLVEVVAVVVLVPSVVEVDASVPVPELSPFPSSPQARASAARERARGKGE